MQRNTAINEVNIYTKDRRNKKSVTESGFRQEIRVKQASESRLLVRQKRHYQITNYLVQYSNLILEHWKKLHVICTKNETQNRARKRTAIMNQTKYSDERDYSLR
jgi:hypothetical protein